MIKVLLSTSRFRRSAIRSAVLAIVIAAAACGVKQSRYVMLGERFPARPPDASVEVFRSEPPARPFQRISRVEVHLEHSLGMPSFEAALPELKKQAQLSGADAIIEIEETRRWYAETGIYHVIGIGIRYSE